MSHARGRVEDQATARRFRWTPQQAPEAPLLMARIATEVTVHSARGGIEACVRVAGRSTCATRKSASQAVGAALRKAGAFITKRGGFAGHKRRRKRRR